MSSFRMRVSQPADCPWLRAAKASRPADVRRRLQPLGTCRRISTSSRLVGRPQQAADRLEAGAKWRDREATRIRKREAIRTWVLRHDPETRAARQALAAAAAAGRDLRPCPSGHLRSQPDRVSRRAAQRPAVRTDRPAVRVQRAVHTAPRVAATVDTLARHLT